MGQRRICAVGAAGAIAAARSRLMAPEFVGRCENQFLCPEVKADGLKAIAYWTDSLELVEILEEKLLKDADDR